ncbi:hypothetical protein DFH29DRAFT_1000288 [Suillus ampliporus]|nr:hypothetical protein DFH29DRAFT_1000288 [Suillus ampliporus]
MLKWLLFEETHVNSLESSSSLLGRTLLITLVPDSSDHQLLPLMTNTSLDIIHVDPETIFRVDQSGQPVVLYECQLQVPCGLHVEGTTSAVSAHLRRHGIFGPDNTGTMCTWGSCSKTLKKGSMPRHILAHLGVKSHAILQSPRMFTDPKDMFLSLRAGMLPIRSDCLIPMMFYIKLQELQKTLDTQGIEIVDNQKESVPGCKQLADRTKEFKKIPDDEKLNSFKGLLKTYQTEIDNLTKRSKVSENAFLNVYKVLAEAPDPYPLLEAAVDQAVKATEAYVLEAEVSRLCTENAELRQSFSTHDASKRRVEQLEACMGELVVQKESKINAAYDERMHNYEEQGQDSQRQVSLYRDQVRDLRLSNESNQAKLFDHSQRQDQEIISRLAETDMIMVDLERANSRVATVEQRNEALRREIEALRTGSERVRSLTTRLSELESECTWLEGAVDAFHPVGRGVATRIRARVNMEMYRPKKHVFLLRPYDWPSLT